MTDLERPNVLPVNLDGIPAGLKSIHRWVLWRYDLTKDRTSWAKTPYQPNGKRSRANDERTWYTFDQVAKALATGHFDGLGIVLGDGLIGLDLDDSGPLAHLAPWAHNIIQVPSTYVESSPSATGIKAFALAQLQGGVDTGACKIETGGLEIYKGCSTTEPRPLDCPAWPEPNSDCGRWEKQHRAFGRWFAVTGHGNGLELTADTALIQRAVDALTAARSAKGQRTRLARTLETTENGIINAQNGQRHTSLIGLGRAATGALLAAGASSEAIRDTIADLGQQAGLPADEALNAAQWLASTVAADAPMPPLQAPRVSPASLPSREQIPDEPIQGIALSFVVSCCLQDEAGDGQLFTKLYADRFCYDRSAGTWYEFRNHIWHELAGPPRPAVWGGLAAVYVNAAAALLQDAERAAAHEDRVAQLKRQADALQQRARLLRRLARINAVLTLAGDIGMLGVSGDSWDADPWLLAVANGVLDLRTAELRPGRPVDYIRTQAPTDWMGLDAPAPRWHRYVAEVMSHDTDRVEFLRCCLGYALNGSSREHILIMLVGIHGRNGKGVLFKTLTSVIGPYAATVHSDVLVGQTHKRIAGSAQPHLMALQGKRIALTSETAEGDQISAAQVKLITGGDEIRARDLFEKDVVFAPQHTLFVATNRAPHAPADDDALWERVRVLEFRARFIDEPHAINEYLRDPLLAETLATEAPGILAWLVQGGLDWLKNGIKTPDSVRLAREKYRRGESLDPFLEACCTLWDAGQAESTPLYDAYVQWCEREKLRPKTLTWFGRQLGSRFEKGRTSTGRSCYYGLSLTPDLSPQTPSEPLGTPDSTRRAEQSAEPSSMAHADDLLHEEHGYKNESDPSIPSDWGSEAPVIHNPAGGDNQTEIPPGYDVLPDAYDSKPWRASNRQLNWWHRCDTHEEAVSTAWLHYQTHHTEIIA